MPKRYDYYHIDCGHYPAQIKLCFSNETFQKVLADHGIVNRDKAAALEDGIAECHYLTDGKQAIIILVFDLKECVNEDQSFLAGIIAHESTHCVCRVFDHIGEPVEEIGEESRAYLTQHIVTQITKGISLELEKNARKANRKSSKQKGEGAGGPEPKVDLDSNGSTGPVSVPEKSDAPGGAKNKKRRPVGKAKDSVPTAKRVRVSSNRVKV